MEKYGRTRRRWLTGALVLLAVWPFAAWCAARALIVRRELPRADAIVVLGGSATYVERTRWAARLFRDGRAPRIVLTNDQMRGGWSSAEQRNPLFVERAAEELRRAGVPDESIEVLPGAATSTHDEALLVRDYASRRNFRAVLIVTSAYHTRRALWTFQRVFREESVEVGLDAPPTGEQSPRPAAWWLQAEGWRSVALEYPKLIYYRVHY